MRARYSFGAGVRLQRGGSLPEFAVAMVVLICFVTMPLVNLGFIIARYAIAESLVGGRAHIMGLAGTRTTAKGMLADRPWQEQLSRFGVVVRSTDFSILGFDGETGERLTLSSGQKVPEQWLRRATAGQSSLLLEVRVRASILPVFGSTGIPGLAGSVETQFIRKTTWEHHGKDPETGEYFLNL